MGTKMSRSGVVSLFALLVLARIGTAVAQTNYQVISIADAGTITGTVKWSGPTPRVLTFPLNKDVAVCDPESRKRVDLERLVIGPEGGVANTVVFLKNVSSGKAMDIPQSRRFLNQKHCRYEPHILLVPENDSLQMTSSDPVLHTVHMEGAATYNLPFPFPDRPISRPMSHAGMVTLKCNGGHLWMNALLMVADNPYYTVTDEKGKFELGGVPPGKYEIVAWHEGWHVVGQQASFDVSTSEKVDRPLFSERKPGRRKWRSTRMAPPRSILLSLKNS
jgi:Polysaccharide lyase family 4, domain II